MKIYFSGKLIPSVKNSDKIVTIKFFQNLSFGFNFKQYKMYKINTQKNKWCEKNYTIILIKGL